MFVGADRFFRYTETVSAWTSGGSSSFRYLLRFPFFRVETISNVWQRRALMTLPNMTEIASVEKYMSVTQQRSSCSGDRFFLCTLRVVSSVQRRATNDLVH